MKIGLAKLAEFQDEATEPMDKANSQDTRVTCLSNCQYAQNPEKLCMLESISMQMMGQEGVFSCGQYVPMEDMIAQQEAESKAATGLDKVKKKPAKKPKKK